MKAQNAIPSISVVIPALNEAAHIVKILRGLPPAPAAEIIVVDGGSEDGTAERARSCGVQVFVSPRGRARQMNLGASRAKGELLLFLHADTRLPAGYDRYVRQILLQPKVVAGAFQLRIDGTSWGLRLIERAANWRARVLQMPYGDQGIFLRASTWREVGGFPDLPIMEDYAMMQRLQKLGRIAIAPVPVITSARRWERLGIWRTTLINQAIILGYSLGISPDRLASWYHRPC